MRDVSYRVVDEAGEGGWMTARLVDLLWRMPSFPAAVGVAGGVPPMHVLNRIVSRGKDVLPTGDGVVWHKLTLSQDEYFQLAEQLLADPRLADFLDGEPDSAQSVDPMPF